MPLNKNKNVRNGLTPSEFNNIANGTNEGLNTSTDEFFGIHDDLDANKISKQNIINQLKYLRDEPDYNNTKDEIKMINRIIKRLKGNI